MLEPVLEPEVGPVLDSTICMVVELEDPSPVVVLVSESRVEPVVEDTLDITSIVSSLDASVLDEPWSGAAGG